MKFLKMVPIIFMFLGITQYPNLSYAESKNPNEYKVLSNTNRKLSISDVQDYLIKGDNLAKNGDFENAKKTYDKARDLARQLAGFYRDLNGSFKGLDARIPLEMDKKGRKSIKIWAQSNLRLASLYKRKKQPEVAVPLLVEIIRLMTPNSPEGKEAYENLLELGFVDTTYKGF
jgi:tetratricopeptide (TPR) repeat protein